MRVYCGAPNLILIDSLTLPASPDQTTFLSNANAAGIDRVIFGEATVEGADWQLPPADSNAAARTITRCSSLIRAGMGNAPGVIQPSESGPVVPS